MIRINITKQSKFFLGEYKIHVNFHFYIFNRNNDFYSSIIFILHQVDEMCIWN